MRTYCLAIPLAASLLLVGPVRADARDQSVPAPAAAAARPIPRSKAFFGLHFDHHPNKDDTELYADITEEMVDKLLTRVRPDFLQYDCKGHPGYTGYPTDVGTTCPGLAKVALEIYRKVTREHGVGLYIHYSGVWDSVAVEKHPEWAVVNANGKPDKNATSVFGPYVDALLIPQLKEVTTQYDLDGIWADGECWAAKLDYSPAALKAWKKETGFETAPKSSKDPHWQEWKDFHRRAFERYLCHWVDALHAHDPELQITSNWMYTTLAPKPVVAKLDSLSGDYSPHLSVDRARVEARYLASTGMPWDLMAWGFDKGDGLRWSLKTPVHLQQESSVVLMQGGGFQIYNTPTRRGYLHPTMIETLGQVADFCRTRQAVSHKSTSVPQIALLLSTETQFDWSDRVFHYAGTTEPLEGTLHALLELAYSVDILAEHQLQPRMRDFPLIVVPDSYKLAEPFRRALLEYVEQGGGLLLLGEKCARLFEPHLGVKLSGKPASVRAELASSAGPVNANGAWQKVELDGAEAIGTWHPTRDLRKDGHVAATLTKHGRGQIAAVWGPVGSVFFRCHHPYLKRFIGDIVGRLFPKPAVEIDGPPCLDIALRRTRAGELCLHVLNLTNMPTSRRYGIIDDIPAVGPIKVRMKVPAKPEAVVWIPGEVKLEWTWSAGILAVTIPRVHVHGVVCVKP